MAGKSRRVASRQAQLNRRRKRQQRGPSGIPAQTREATEVDGRAVDAVGLPATGTGDASPAFPARPRPSPVAGRATPASPLVRAVRSRGERPSAYNYVGTELRRILITAGGAVAIIIVLGIVL